MEKQQVKSSLSPFLKWAGGKRWLVGQEPDIFPTQYDRYIEPFLGGGAVFFHLQPRKALLSDSNHELIDTYSAIRDDYKLVLRYLKDHQKHHSADYYYQMRASRPRSIFTRAARMLYLNRTCWNGLYRVNLKGDFNVPIGTKNNVLMNIDAFPMLSEQLKTTELVKGDFELTLSQSREGDFVFVDPPYTVKHNHNGFVKYNENLFAWEDQVRLKKLVDEATDRGSKVLVLNAAHPSIMELYSEYEQRELSRKNVLSGKPEYRGVYEELAIKNW